MISEAIDVEYYDKHMIHQSAIHEEKRKDRMKVVLINEHDCIFTFCYDAFSSEVMAANGVSIVLSVRRDNGDCTSEMTLIGNEGNTVSRDFDSLGRLTETDGTGYAYNFDGLFAAISNEIVVAACEYDDFGRTISQSRMMAEDFRISFSTKYYDPETGLYYYGYRFYSPSLMRWLNRDPIEEEGGMNLYGFCENNAVSLYDMMGLSCKLGTFNVLRLDTWEKPAANGLSTNPNFIKNGEALLSSLGTLGNLTTLSSPSSSALANFQTFVDALAGKGTTPSADALEGIRRLYEHLKHGPVTIYGELEYELCVCKGRRTVFEKQELIKDNETVLDRSDQLEVIRARGELLKWMINEMYKKKRRK